jgi:hypothetical protein
MLISRHFTGKYCAYRRGRSWRNRQRTPFMVRAVEAIRKGIGVVLMTDEPQGSVRPR